MNELGLSARGSSAQGVLPGATHTTRAAYQTIFTRQAVRDLHQRDAERTAPCSRMEHAKLRVQS